MDSVTSMSALLARQRHSNKLELRDVQHHLSRAWGIHVPGYTQMDEWREVGGGRAEEAQEGEEEGDVEMGRNVRGKDFSGGVAALQRLKAFRKAAVSETHKRRLQIISQAKVSARNNYTCQHTELLARAGGLPAAVFMLFRMRAFVCVCSLLLPTVVVRRMRS